MPSPTKDKLKRLLAKNERKVPDAVRLKEMNEVRNYNRNQFAKVFDLEKQQVSREQESIAPASARDVGSAFKLQVYILKLNQILQLKQETYQQLSTSMEGEPVSKLRGVRNQQAALATSFFSKAELLSAYNEMMAFIKLYMPDLLNNNRQLEQIYTSFFTPLATLLKQVQGLYPRFFESNVPRPRAGNAFDRQTFELMWQQSLQLYSLLGCMAEFLDDQNLRPITAQDVSLYIKDNNVRLIFAADAGALPALDPALDRNLQRQQALDAAAAAAQALPAAPQPNIPPAAPGQQQQQQRAMTNAEAVVLYAQQQSQQGVANNLIFRNAAAKVPDIRLLTGFNESDSQIKKSIKEFIAANAQYAPAKGRLPAQQPPQGQAAVVPGLLLRDLAPGNAVVDVGGVAGRLLQGVQSEPEARELRSLIAQIVPIVKGIESQEQRVLPPTEGRFGGVPLVYEDIRAQFPQLHQSMIDVFTFEDDAKSFIKRILQAFKDTRTEYAAQEAQDQGNPALAGTQNTLWGLGRPHLKAFVARKGLFPSKRNAKDVAHFLKLGIPPEVIFKLMKHHGIRDGALAEEIEGSGIFDTLKDLAKSAVSSVKDSAKGWSSTIKKNMPNMSDVRRGVDKIVPDSLQKYLPDSIKTTIGDKAKDFFGFGASENGGIATRHLEPFSAPNVDKWGYNQGAAERMRTMPVDKELVSGLRRLTGGDQLRDTDPEILRRADHHDVNVPAVQEQPVHGYGADGDEDDQKQGGLKQRLIGMPYSMFAPRGGKSAPQLFAYNPSDNDPYFDGFEGGAEGFYEEEEKPHDKDEDPTPFRVRNENYAVNTGRLKKVTYKD